MTYELYKLKIENSGLFECTIVNTKANKMWCMNDYLEFDRYKQALSSTDLIKELKKDYRFVTEFTKVEDVIELVPEEFI